MKLRPAFSLSGVKRRFGESSIHYICLFVALQVIYLHLSFSPFSTGYLLKWDLVDFHYLFNLFNSDAYRSGQVPLWNPYVLSGVPWSSMLETKVFYPVQMLVSMTVGYSYAVMQAEFMLTLFFAGAGVFKLLKGMKLGTAACYLGAITYSSSGIFVGNSEHFGQIIVYAFAPWIFSQLYKIYTTNEVKHAIYGAILLAVTVMGGYPGTYIVLAYLMVVVCGAMILGSPDRRRTVLNLAVMTLLSVGMAAVHLVPCYQAFPYISRAAGLPYDIVVSSESLAPINLFSMVFPKAASDPAFVGASAAEMTMINVHLGSMSLLLAAIALVASKNRRLKWLVFSLVVFSLAAAMGDHTFVRPLTYHYFPFMDKIRLNSAIFRGYSILGLAVLAALGLQDFLDGKSALKRSWWLLGFPLLVALTIFLSNLEPGLKSVLLQDLPLLALIVALYSITVWMLAKGAIHARTFTGVILVLLVAEFSYAVQCNSITLWEHDPGKRSIITSLESKRDARFAGLAGSARVHSYPEPDNWRPLLGRIRTDGGYFSGSILSDYQGFMDSKAAYALLKEPVVFPRTVTYYAEKQEVMAFLDKPSVNPLEDAYVKAKPGTNAAGSAISYTGGASFLSITKFTLNTLEFAYRAEHDRFALINEVYYPGWTAHIKETGKALPVVRTNLTLRGIYLPAGSGTVVMEFAPPNYRVAKWVSLTSALLTLCLLIYVQCRRRTSGAQVPLSNEDSPRHSHLSTL